MYLIFKELLLNFNHFCLNLVLQLSLCDYMVSKIVRVFVVL